MRDGRRTTKTRIRVHNSDGTINETLREEVEDYDGRIHTNEHINIYHDQKHLENSEQNQGERTNSNGQRLNKDGTIDQRIYNGKNLENEDNGDSNN